MDTGTRLYRQRQIEAHLDTPGRVLFAKIVERAETIGGGYMESLKNWLVHGGTVSLRDDLCADFGDHMRDLDHFNAFASVDTARAHAGALA